MGEMRFGVSLAGWRDGPALLAAARTAEREGFDAVTVADHLGHTAPFTVLAAAAAVTSRVRLRTYVLDAYFWNAALLAREVATLDRLSGGREELGDRRGTHAARARRRPTAVPAGGRAVEAHRGGARRGAAAPRRRGAHTDARAAAGAGDGRGHGWAGAEGRGRERRRRRPGGGAAGSGPEGERDAGRARPRGRRRTRPRTGAGRAATAGGARRRPGGDRGDRGAGRRPSTGWTG
jgi:alkanesulfonate monooxygenase SsuD/methylene tetrahydromethanopterin reductase-like flavin-dependent oxidoreductase (luciferase family)